MKRISILMILILLLTLGCAPKNSMESGDPNVSKAEPSTELQIQEEPRNVSIPSLYNEGENESVEKEDSVSDQVQNNDQAGSSLPHLYEDVTPPPQKPEAPSTPARVGIGLAWMVGGFLVFHVGEKVEDVFFRLHNVYLKLLPAMAREEQLKIGEAFAARTARLAQKFGLRQQVAEKLAARIIVTRSATGIGVKKGFSGLLGRAVGLAKWAAPFMWGIGLLQIVFEPTEVGGEGDEIGPKERFNFLKENIEALEKNPHDLYLQDRVIQSTMGHLYDVINMLEYESNQTYLGFEELNARQDISAQDKESAQKELEEFWAEQDSLIEYFKITSEALKEIYYVEDSDRSKAEEILQETMKKLEAVF